MSDRSERGLVQTSFGYIHYRARGEGPVVLLLHPNQQSSALYRELIDALSAGARALAIDYPSHGCSDPMDEQPTIADYARCALEVADALGIERFVPLGESTGAAVAIELAATRPDRVPRAILVNCPYNEEPADAMLAPFKDQFRPADASGFPLTRTLDFMLEVDPVHAPLAPSQDWMDRMNQAQIACGRRRWQALTALARYDMAAGLARVPCPTLLLTGEHFYFRDAIPKIAARVPGLTSAILVGGRVCVGWECAEAIAARALPFLTDAG